MRKFYLYTLVGAIVLAICTLFASMFDNHNEITSLSNSTKSSETYHAYKDTLTKIMVESTLSTDSLTKFFYDKPDCDCNKDSTAVLHRIWFTQKDSTIAYDSVATYKNMKSLIKYRKKTMNAWEEASQARDDHALYVSWVRFWSWGSDNRKTFALER